MTATVQPTEAAVSRLRELRQRLGISGAELARQAGVAPNTVLAAEHGRPIERASQRAIGEALSILLQRAEFRRIGEARGALVTAELERDAVERRVVSVREALAEVETTYEDNVRAIASEVIAVWDETHEDPEQ
jgi:transcriptional regulator with XRE-family HTH domain